MYTEFFGFKEKPFNVTPDPRFLYLSPAHQEALATMLYGIQERRGFVSVIGEIGTGKTTLLHTLFNELNSDVQTAFIFNTKITFRQLLQNILIELGLESDSDNKALLLNQLNDYLIGKLALNETVALIIDESQNLSSKVLEELRMLSNLETTKEKLLQIILVGQPELDFKLRSHDLRQLKQRIGINCYLTPLNNSEQKKYIEHRLNIAGSSSRQIFSQKALDLICQSAKGIPRIINILCDNALLTAYSKGISKIDIDIIRDVATDFTSTSSPIEKSKDPSATSIEVSENKGSNKRLFFTLYLILIIQTLLILIFLYINAQGTNLGNILPNLPFINKPLATDKAFSEKLPSEPVSNPNAHEELNTLYSVLKIEETPVDQILTKTHSLPHVYSPLQIPHGASSTSNILLPEKFHQVSAKEGDIVSALALVQYGTLNDTIIDLIKRANPNIPDLNRIEIGQEILFPSIEINNLIVKNENGTFSIHVSTSSSYDSALRQQKKYEDNNHYSSISPVKVVGKNNWYRVTVGSFPTRLGAIKYAKSTKLVDTLYPF